mgnify:FL=1
MSAYKKGKSTVFASTLTLSITIFVGLAAADSYKSDGHPGRGNTHRVGVVPDIGIPDIIIPKPVIPGLSC